MSRPHFGVHRVFRRALSSVRGALDVPAAPTLVRGRVRFEGWALDANRAPGRVDLMLNKAVSIPTRVGVDRADVRVNLNDPGAAIGCGWTATVDLAPYPPGRLTVKAMVVKASGETIAFAGRTYELVDEIAAPSESLQGPRWEWDLPDFLADTPAVVIGTISPDERMPAEDDAVYRAVGCSALKVVRLAQIASGKADFTSILDMPCGHGRVMRWLKAAYPAARLTACDLIVDGVDFCAETFGATPVYSTPAPAATMFNDTYDLIFVGSLLTHVDVHQWDHLIELWHTLLAPDGLLVVTTHGELVAERMRAGHLYGYPAAAVTRTLRAYEHAGFAFLEEPDKIDYGITISKPEWTLSRLLRHPDFRVVLSSEALWTSHQDVTAVVKRPLTRR